MSKGWVQLDIPVTSLFRGLTRTVDCVNPLSSGTNSMECRCRKSCAPTSKSKDDCCRKMVPAFAQFLQRSHSISVHTPDLVADAVVSEPGITRLPEVCRQASEPNEQPPTIEAPNTNLPLLI